MTATETLTAEKTLLENMMGEVWLGEVDGELRNLWMLAMPMTQKGKGMDAD